MKSQFLYFIPILMIWNVVFADTQEVTIPGYTPPEPIVTQPTTTNKKPLPKKTTPTVPNSQTINQTQPVQNK